MQIDFTHEFDELHLPDGTWFSAYGKAEITAEVCATYGDVESFKIDEVSLEVGGKDFLPIDDRHPLWKAIITGLEASEWLKTKLAEDIEENHGPFRSLDGDRGSDQHGWGL